MDYEKKYKDAQKWIESIYTELSHERQMEAEAFFPELKESWDDKVRKQILSFLKELERNHYRNLDFTIYYPLKNGKGKYESIPYSFYGTLTSCRRMCEYVHKLQHALKLCGINKEIEP